MKRLFILPSLVFILLVSCQPHPSTVTLALLGDLMLGRGVKAAPDSLAYLKPELHAADLSLANLESPLTNDPPAAAMEAGYNLCAAAPAAGVLDAWGLDLLSLANNHRFDCNPAGANETIRILTNLDLAPIGPGLEPIYREINGLKLAFLAFDDISSPLDEPAAMQAIHTARAAGSMVIVSVHWGMEYQAGPSDRQKALAQQFAEAGAALIVGTHPHVLQPAEWIRTASEKTLVLYSLGNAMFDQGGLADTRQAALVAVTLDSKGVKSARAVPFEIDAFHGRVIQPGVQTARQILKRINLP
jgi:poly-gamma-glutamate capsule biosynthesis protein CapA/YwtB (metallophosphatase superfamily)